MIGRKERETSKAPSGRTEAKGADQVVGITRTMKKVLAGFGKTWKLYKDSKTGLAGLAIVFSFLFMAVFAPWISPYSSEFKAPGIDVFVADSVNLDMGESLNWTAPMGLLDNTREKQLERILVYAEEGVAKIYPVSQGVQDGVLSIVVDDPTTYPAHASASYIEYMYFPRTASELTFFFVLQGSTLYEYTANFVDANVQYVIAGEDGVPFVPKYRSNTWNAYSVTLNQARMALVFADDSSIWLIDKRPRSQYDPVVRTFVSNKTISGATIIGNPVVIDSDYFDNGSMIVVPTTAGLYAYDLVVTKTALTQVVTNVAIGDLRWQSPYTYKESDFEPIDSANMITYPYPYGASDAFGKTHIMLATTQERMVAYERETGNISYDNPVIMPSISDFGIDSVYPSPAGVILVGRTGERGFIASFDAQLGVVRYNNTMYSLTDSEINCRPQYVNGLRTFVYSTVMGNIYLSNELLGVNVTFSTPGGSETPVALLGNIYIESSVTGNYYAVITNENSLFAQTLSGVNRAPLPPGTYPSGNRYILGTDYEGHDVLSWVIYGARAELMVGITAAFFAVVVGTIVGLVAGFYPGIIDDLLMRATDVVLSLPGLVIILLFASVFGPSLLNIVIIIGILSWASIARVIRSVTLSLKERSFVDAAIIAGASESRLIFKHIAPNVLPYTFLYMTFTISGAIVTEAILAFLGFGDVNYVTWGMMLQYLQISGHSLDAPWWLLPPGIAITLLSLSFYLIGRAFDEVVNPRLRRR